MSHAPKVIVGALLIVAGANAWMIHNAVTHPSAPASDDHWAESLQTNDVLAEREASAALGWRVRLEACTGEDPASCMVRAQVTDTEGKAIPVKDGQLRFMRADTAHFDREAVVTATTARGELRGSWAPAAPGLYTVEMQLRGAEGQAWSQRREIRVEGRAR